MSDEGDRVGLPARAPLPWRGKLEAALEGLGPVGSVDEAQRLIRASAVIQAAFETLGLRLVVVGGSALTVWRPDRHVSGDIDLVGPSTRVQLDQVLRGQFGFTAEGRHWIDSQLGIFVERPGTVLEPYGAGVVTVPRFGVEVTVIAIEDLILDRVHSWDAGGDLQSFVQAWDMLGYTDVDHDRLEQRAAAEGLTVQLACVVWLGQQGIHDRGDDPGGECHACWRGSRDRGLEGCRQAVVDYPAWTPEDESG